MFTFTNNNIISDKKRLADYCISVHLWILLGYAILGRGFAYLGIPPLYIGEISLLFCIIAQMQTKNIGKVFSLFPAKMLAVLIFWTIIRTVPFLKIYGINSLRDAVITGYGIFAFLFASFLIETPKRLRVVLIKYRTFSVIFLFIIGVVFLSCQMNWLDIKLPGSPARIGTYKGGDILVHLAGISAYFLTGIGYFSWPLILLTGINFVIAGVASRAGIVAFGLALIATIAFRPPQPKQGSIIYVILLIVVLLGLFNPQITYHKRTLSLEQIAVNVMSLVEKSKDSLDSSKKWRLEWWKDIVGYTFKGKYFWGGKGFGINLADADGYQVTSDGSLRSPHNGHLSILARSGVVGFTLWILTIGSWFLLMLKNLIYSINLKQRKWRSIFTFLIAYWIAFIVNTAFDVFIEGPVGGIWLWTLFGIGLAVSYIYKNTPEIIEK